MNVQSERTANTKGPEVGVLGKKKQVRKGKSRTSKGKRTHHETGGEWHGQIMQGCDGHHKDSAFTLSGMGSHWRVLSGGVTKIQLSF